MTNPATTDPPAGPPPALPGAHLIPDPSAPDPATRRRLWFEVAAVAALGVLPDFVSSLQHVAAPDAGAGQTFRQLAISLIVRSVGVGLPVLYIMWRSGEGFAAFGLKRFRPGVDLCAGIGLWALTYVAYLAAWNLIALVPAAVDSAYAWDAELRLDEVFPRPSGATDYVLLLFMSAANGFGEELVICGLLLTRLAVLLGSTPRAVAVCSLAMASYHLYQGPINAAMIFVMTLVTVGLFAATRRLWPFAIGHAIQDVVGIIGQ